MNVDVNFEKDYFAKNKEKILESIMPEISQNEFEKLAIILQLVGGKLNKSGEPFPINVLILGNPSTAKSEIFKSIKNSKFPNVEDVSSSNIDFKNFTEFLFENNNLVVLDEMDKILFNSKGVEVSSMNEFDLKEISKILQTGKYERKQISTPILAGANFNNSYVKDVSSFNESAKLISEAISLELPFYFDLFFFNLDTPRVDIDLDVAECILTKDTRIEKDEKVSKLDIFEVYKFLNYVKYNFNPILPLDLQKYIYKILFNLFSRFDLKENVGLLDKVNYFDCQKRAIEKLAIASAKLNQRKKVNIDDVNLAFDFLNNTLSNLKIKIQTQKEKNALKFTNKDIKDMIKIIEFLEFKGIDLTEEKILEEVSENHIWDIEFSRVLLEKLEFEGKISKFTKDKYFLN